MTSLATMVGQQFKPSQLGPLLPLLTEAKGDVLLKTISLDTGVTSEKLLFAARVMGCPCYSNQDARNFIENNCIVVDNAADLNVVHRTAWVDSIEVTSHVINTVAGPVVAEQQGLVSTLVLTAEGALVPFPRMPVLVRAKSPYNIVSLSCLKEIEEVDGCLDPSNISGDDPWLVINGQPITLMQYGGLTHVAFAANNGHALSTGNHYAMFIDSNELAGEVKTLDMPPGRPTLLSLLSRKHTLSEHHAAMNHASEPTLRATLKLAGIEFLGNDDKLPFCSACARGKAKKVRTGAHLLGTRCPVEATEPGALVVIDIKCFSEPTISGCTEAMVWVDVFSDQHSSTAPNSASLLGAPCARSSSCQTSRGAGVSDTTWEKSSASRGLQRWGVNLPMS
jgi:hypothetical protein